MRVSSTACPQCAAANGKTAKFCSECGVALK
ncbi:zinc-ribbon domain-containing protein [Burkholderia sp. Ac-20353]|nr:zinc-ribbon domain-containing protein [Burkholderia sp. Ac-20353]